MTTQDRNTPAPAVPALVEAALADYPDATRDRVLQLREVLWEVVAAEPAIGVVEESLKWGQPSYRPATAGTGTTVRIDRVSGSDDVAVFTPCSTSLVAEFRAAHGSIATYDGKRGVIVPAEGEIPLAALRDHMREALLYFQR